MIVSSGVLDTGTGQTVRVSGGTVQVREIPRTVTLADVVRQVPAAAAANAVKMFREHYLETILLLKSRFD